ncbi:MAG: cbb3-type cytochrome c oxidase subunit 3 [Pseudomonadota bacterium]
MDAGFIGSVMTVLSFLVFVAIVWWAFHKGNKQKFEDAAHLPFREDADEARKPD